MPKKDSKSIIASGKLEDELLALKLGVERADQAIFITDKEGIILYINPAFEKTYGYSPKEALGKTPRILKSGKEHQSMYEHFWNTLLNKNVVDLDIINKTKDGRFLTIKATANPILNKEGVIIGFLSIQSDITDKIKTHKKLVEAEKNYRDIVDNSPDMIHSVDKEGFIVFANKKECEILGYKPDEIIGKNIYDIYSKKLAETVKRGFKKLKDDGKLYIPDGKMVGKDGKEIDVEIDSISIKDDKGVFIRTRSIIRDVTERKRVKEELMTSEEKYRSVVENANEMILVVQDGRVKFANHKAEEITGYSLEEALTKSYLDFIHPDDQKIVIENYTKRLNGEIADSIYTFRIVSKKGEVRWVEIHAVLFVWEDRPASLNFMTDISERKSAEDELKSKIEQMEFMGRVNLKRYKKMLQMQKEIIDLKKRLGEETPSIEELKEFMPEVKL